MISIKIDIIKIRTHLLLTSGKDYPMKNLNVFDESKIVFSFAAISDIHMCNDNTGRDKDFFTNALRQIKEFGNVDAILAVGDLINAGGYGGKFEQMRVYKKVYESVFDPKEMPMIFAVGNHDVHWSAESKIYADKLNEFLGPDYFLNDVDHNIRETEGNRHCVVNGYHIITLLPVTYTQVSYTQATKDWLDQTLAQITTENPNAYVIILTHPMIYDTVYGSTLAREPGSTLKDMWVTSDLTDILSKYNQVVTFGGHLHFPINDPRTIMQTAFTSLGCGSVSYMAIEDGNYENMASVTTMNDKYEFSQGLICQIDENGNMRINRMDFYNKTTIDTPWEISHPTADGSHLTAYGKDRGFPENNSAPIISKHIQAIMSDPDDEGNRNVVIEFGAAKDDTFAHHYTMEFKKAGEPIKTFNILSDFYRVKTPSEMKDTLTCNIGVLSPADYEVILTAYDSWGAASEPISYKFTI